MTRTTKHAERVLLMLDLSEQNQLEPEQVLEQRGEVDSTEVFSATDFGAVRADTGWAAEHSRGYSQAIETMMVEARPYIGPHTEVLIAGRAGLASYAELGLRYSTWGNDDVTVINRRRDLQWDFCPVSGGNGDSEPFFDQVHFPRRPASQTGRVAVVISSGYRVRPDLIKELFERENETLLSTVVLQAVPPVGQTYKEVTAENSPAIAQAIFTEIGKIQLAYPGQRGLAIFIAGPAQLAFFAGRAVNPNVYPSVWFPHKNGNHYVVGSKVPWIDKVRVRMLMAAPSDLDPIDLNTEAALAGEVLDRPEARDRFDLSVKHAATYDDFFEMMLCDKPQIVHFSGHGKEDAIALTTDGGTTDIIPADALEKAVQSAQDPITPPRLIILNACKSEDQAKRLTDHVDFAIGMRHNIKDSRAISFTRRFYAALAMGRSLQNAFDQGVASLSKWGSVSADQPQLYSRAGYDAKSVTFVER